MKTKQFNKAWNLLFTYENLTPLQIHQVLVSIQIEAEMKNMDALSESLKREAVYLREALEKKKTK